MTWRDEIDMEIRRQAIRLYPDCAALFELPLRVYQRVSTEEFFKVIGPLNVTLEIRGNYPYKTLFRLKQGGKLVGFEEHERYYLNVEDTRL